MNTQTTQSSNTRKLYNILLKLHHQQFVYKPYYIQLRPNKLSKFCQNVFLKIKLLQCASLYFY